MRANVLFLCLFYFFCSNTLSAQVIKQDAMSKACFYQVANLPRGLSVNITVINSSCLTFFESSDPAAMFNFRIVESSTNKAVGFTGTQVVRCKDNNGHITYYFSIIGLKEGVNYKINVSRKGKWITPMNGCQLIMGWKNYVNSGVVGGNKAAELEIYASTPP